MEARHDGAARGLGVAVEAREAEQVDDHRVVRVRALGENAAGRGRYEVQEEGKGCAARVSGGRNERHAGAHV